MHIFPSAGHLSSWAGLCPGNRRSAGKDKGGTITRGNRWLRTTLTQCAWAASAKKTCYLRGKFWRLVAEGKKRAICRCRSQPSRSHLPCTNHWTTVSRTRCSHYRRTPETALHSASCTSSRPIRHQCRLPTRRLNGYFRTSPVAEVHKEYSQARCDLSEEKWDDL
jgi:Transposase IS116/IS110/IS902 family